VASEGRKFGVYLIIVSQRPSRVDPDVISQCQSQVIMRIVNPKDQEAVRESSELLAQEFLENLPGLDVGEAVILGPLTKLPVVVKIRDRVLDYGGADIDLKTAWKIDRSIDVVQLWRRIFNKTPTPSLMLAASRLKVVEKRRDGSRIIVEMYDGGAKISVVIEEGRPTCSLCGIGKDCPHVYKALEEILEIR